MAEETQRAQALLIAFGRGALHDPPLMDNKLSSCDCAFMRRPSGANALPMRFPYGWPAANILKVDFSEILPVKPLTDMHKYSIALKKGQTRHGVGIAYFESLTSECANDPSVHNI